MISLTLPAMETITDYIISTFLLLQLLIVPHRDLKQLIDDICILMATNLFTYTKH